MPTLQQMMQEVGVALGTLVQDTTTGAGSTTTLVCSTFANTGLYRSTTLDQQYVLIVEGNNLGEQRSVSAGGLTVATGTVTVSSAFANTVASGIDFWMSGRLPLYQTGLYAGLRECVNRAMRRLLVRRRIDITGVDNQQIYPLAPSTYPWMQKDSILGLYDPQSDANVPLEETRHKWVYKENGESPAIEFPNGAPWRTGETAQMLVQCPANSYLRVSGTWTNQASPTAGLSVLTDESLAKLSDVTTVALAYAYRELAKWANGTEAEEWRGYEATYTRRARNLPNYRRKQRENAGIPNLNPRIVAYPLAG